MQTTTAPVQQKPRFKAITNRKSECRCCGKGREIICDDCQQLMDEGYAFLLEVKEGSTADRKSPTGFVIAVYTEGLYENKEADHPMQPDTIYFIQVSDLKTFMNGRYFQFNKTGSHIGSKFIGKPYYHRKPHTANPASTAGFGQAALLSHG